MSRKPKRNGFSLASILLLTAVVAIFLAAVRTAMVDEGPPDPAADMRGAGGGIVGLFVGIGIGVTRTRRVLGIGLGILVGWFVGGAAGMLLSQAKTLPLVFIGSAVLIALGVVVRRFSSPPA